MAVDTELMPARIWSFEHPTALASREMSDAVALDSVHEHLALGVAATIAVAAEAEITVAKDCGNHDKGDDVLKASVVAEEAVVAVGHHAHEGGAVYASVLQQGGKHRGKTVVRGSRARVRKSENRSLILSHIEISFTLRSNIAP